MSDVLSPFIVPPPLPPSSSTTSRSNNTMPMLYYGLAVVGTAAIILAIYNLLIIKSCNNNWRAAVPESQPERSNNNNNNNNRLVEVVVTTSSEGEGGRTIGNHNNPQRNYLLSSFKYKKEVSTTKLGLEGEEKQQKGGDDNYDDADENECPVCLSIYEEGEDVRKLPRCKHSFHAICIDTWLYSHFDCPICRTPIGPFYHPFPAENSS